MSSPPAVSERAVIFLIGAVQFVNILDFVMVMPLGPFFAEGLQIDSAHIGYVAGSYTAAASVAGLVGGYFLDRFDRRKALAVSMLGLVLATAAGGLASGLSTMVLARVMAGIFGGPATSLSLAIIADIIPAERRGKAMGAVMGSFSVAQVVGLPLSLQAANLAGWRAPFLGVAAMGVLVVLGAIFFLPPMRGHLEQGARPGHKVGTLELLGRRDVQLSYVMSAFVMMSGFVLIPNIPTHLVQNLGYPRHELWVLYFVGGFVSFATLRLAGRWVDKYGSFRVGSIGVFGSVAMTYLGFVNYPQWLPIYALFMGFMMSMGLRNVAYNTLTSRVPENAVRARFLSLQSAISHMASALGSAAIAPLMLTNLPDGRLGGVAEVAWVSIVLTLLVPLMLYIVERRVRSRVPSAQAVQTAEAAAKAAVAQVPAPTPAGTAPLPSQSNSQR
ncbi:MFS transporter [Hyalangium rubrum]|uniref:MFS transporter n=1 Tax=Hyalangium rubrum TaxID=3103134 RepID=A0ABU5HF88_9BACT|nr:MFS transporter [Hyalangium sp. s54d21]MDY7231916.1 MFS transporter [Hyalangium sp. s54d21]